MAPISLTTLRLIGPLPDASCSRSGWKRVSGARDRIAQVGTVSRINRVGSDSSWMLRTAAIRTYLPFNLGGG